MLRLRTLREGDLGWVIFRHGEIYKKEFGWDSDFEILVAEIATAFAKKNNPKYERAWIAELDGERVGCVYLVRQSKDVAKLRILLVEPTARGRGVGNLLVKRCISFSKKVGYKKITLWTNSVLASAGKIYLAHGFYLVDESPHFSFGKKLVGQNYNKDLSKG